MNNRNFINFMNVLNNMNNNLNNNLDNNLNDIMNFMNQMNNSMNINNINNNINYNNINDMINKINFNLNSINNNLNNIITSMNNINNILKEQNNNFPPINFIKEIINKNIQMANQIFYNNNIINLTINNPLFFQNQNKINEQNNQAPNSKFIPVKEKIKMVDDYFPGNNNRRMRIIFETAQGNTTIINAPVNLKIKELLLVYAKKIEINPNLLGKQIFFLNNGYKTKINEEKDLISYGLCDLSKFIVVDSKNTIGGNSFFKIKI